MSLDEDQIYFTDAVKHFKYTVKGARRFYQNPSIDEVGQCSTWLYAELAFVKPLLVIVLGGKGYKGCKGYKGYKGCKGCKCVTGQVC